MAWATAHRPVAFHEVLGNTYVKEKLQQMLMQRQVPQALMFTGESGTGKTTLARLTATSLLCGALQNGERCGECPTCRSVSLTYIIEGRNVQGVPIHEYDIAKFNKREDIAKIVERIQQRLLNNQPTIYVLDEIQRATPEAQSCFLKVIENPQPNVHIILCTTDEHKLIAPLRSRFHQIRVQKPTVDELVAKMHQICRDEGVNYTTAALRLIALKMHRAPRDVFNKLEFVGLTGDVTVERVYEELQLTEDNYYKEFFIACMEGNLYPIMQMVDTLEHSGNLNFTQFVRGMGDYLVRAMKLRAGVEVPTMTQEEIQNLRQLNQRITNKVAANIFAYLDNYTSDRTYTINTFIALAVQISELFVTEQPQQEMSPQVAQQQYFEVTQEVARSLVEANITPVESVTEEQFLDIFGVDNVQVIPSSNE